MTEDEIRTLVLKAFEEATIIQFGPKPSPAVQIQIANARTRLVAFARVQAQTFAEGWLIVDVERKLSADDAQPIPLDRSPLRSRRPYRPPCREPRVARDGLQNLQHNGRSREQAPRSRLRRMVARSEIRLAIKWESDKAWIDCNSPLPKYSRALA